MRLSSGVAARLMKDRETPIAEVCEAVGVFRATLYRYLKPDGTLRQLLKTPPA
jgi:predicted DNA-binding transcriptional regulator AlpA